MNKRPVPDTDGDDSPIHSRYKRLKKEEEDKSRTRHVEELFSDEYSDQLEATKWFNSKLETQEGYNSLEGVIQKHIVQRLNRFLAKDYKGLTIQTVCALNWLADWDADILSDGVPLYAKLSRSKDDDISEEAFHMLGKLARKSLQLRDLVLENEVLGLLLAEMEVRTRISKLKVVAWTLSIIYRSRPQLNIGQVCLTVTKLSRVIRVSQDVYVIHWSCMCICYLSMRKYGHEQLIYWDVCEPLGELLFFQRFNVAKCAVAALQSIVCRNTADTKEYHQELIWRMCLIMGVGDSYVVLKTLDTLFCILHGGGMETGLYVNMIDRTWKRIKDFRHHEDHEVARRANRLVDRFYVQDDDSLGELSDASAPISSDSSEHITDSDDTEPGSTSDSGGSISDSP